MIIDNNKWIMDLYIQLTSLYGGPLEFLFVVDSTEDPAYHAVSRLLLDFKVCFTICNTNILLISNLSYFFLLYIFFFMCAG